MASIYGRVVSNVAEAPAAESPLAELANTPSVGLMEAVSAACQDAPFTSNATDAAALAKAYKKAAAFGTNAVANGTNRGLNADQVAALHLYTLELPYAFYSTVNASIGGYGPYGRDGVPHYLKYCKLVLEAMALLPDVATVTYRGVPEVPLPALIGEGATVGTKVQWWSFTSSTETSDVLRDPQFFGMGDNARTVFKFHVKTAVRIKLFSDFGGQTTTSVDNEEDDDDDGLVNGGDEDEVLIRPGTRFVITEISSYPGNVTEVTMDEVVDSVDDEVDNYGYQIPKQVVAGVAGGGDTGDGGASEPAAAAAAADPFGPPPTPLAQAQFVGGTLTLETAFDPMAPISI
jgi:hypothetical protein